MQSLLSNHRPQATRKPCLNSHNRVHGRKLVSVEGGDCSKRNNFCSIGNAKDITMIVIMAVIGGFSNAYDIIMIVVMRDTILIIFMMIVILIIIFIIVIMIIILISFFCSLHFKCDNRHHW